MNVSDVKIGSVYRNSPGARMLGIYKSLPFDSFNFFKPILLEDEFMVMNLVFSDAWYYAYIIVLGTEIIGWIEVPTRFGIESREELLLCEVPWTKIC